jgi:hypothetical protein
MLTLTQNPEQHKTLLQAMPLRTVVASPKQSHFGNQAVLKSAAVIGETAVERFSNRIYPFFRKIGKFEMGKMGGLGLEDWAARFLTLVGLYVPQGYIAVKNDSHVWETNGRNALMWLLAVGIVSFSKNDKWGFNTVLNHFMKNKQTADTKTFWGKLTARFGLDGDYFKVLKEAGIPHKAEDAKRAFWASMDSNMVDRLVHQYDQLTAKGKLLTETEQASHKLLGQFLSRRNAFSLTSTALITGLTVYLVGKLAMDFVFKFIAPLDHDYEPPLKKGLGPQQPTTLPQYPHQNYPPQQMPISMAQSQWQTPQAINQNHRPLRSGTIFAGAFESHQDAKQGRLSQ